MNIKSSARLIRVLYGAVWFHVVFVKFRQTQDFLHGYITYQYIYFVLIVSKLFMEGRFKNTCLAQLKMMI